VVANICLAAVIEGSCKSICTFCYSAIEVLQTICHHNSSGKSVSWVLQNFDAAAICKDQIRKAFVSKAGAAQYLQWSAHKVTSSLDSWLRLHVDCRFWVDIGTAWACLGSRYSPCSEEKHQVHNSSFVGDGFSLICTFSSHQKEEEL
jgi:hypothetical protein